MLVNLTYYLRKSLHPYKDKSYTTEYGGDVIMFYEEKGMALGKMYWTYLAASLYGNPYTLEHGETDSKAWLKEQGYKKTPYSELPPMWKAVLPEELEVLE